MSEEENTTGYLELNQVRKVEDLERLEPHVFALLAATPATALDMFRTKLEFEAALQQLSDSFERSLKTLQTQIRGSEIVR